MSMFTKQCLQKELLRKTNILDLIFQQGLYYGDGIVQFRGGITKCKI